MNKLLSGCLFTRDRKKFDNLREKANSFNINFNGRNIIQDDIFRIMINYAKIKEMPLELLRFPISDKEMCACTFVRRGRIFVLINTRMPLSKQIFAAAHELYHVFCYLDDDAQELILKGSILKSETIEESSNEIEELLANAFAGLLLVPADILNEQIGIYKIQTKKMSMTDVLMLMEIFAVPYKAIILRLYEDGLISESQAEKMIEIPTEELQKNMKITGLAKRYETSTEEICQFGSLETNMLINETHENVMGSRLESDKFRIQEIKESLMRQE